jgi:hypothetical protein
MTLYYAQNDGNFSAVAWNTSADGLGDNFSGTPGNASSDEFDANGHTIAIDVNPFYALGLRCPLGGGFTIDLSSAKSVSTDLYGRHYATGDCLIGTGSHLLTVTGGCWGGNGQNADDSTSGGVRGGHGVVAQNVSVTGTCAGGAGGTSTSTNNGFSGGDGGDGVSATTVTITGECRGGNGGNGIYDSDGVGGKGGNGVTAPTITVNGNSYGGDGGSGAGSGSYGPGGHGGDGGQGITGGSGSTVSGAWTNGTDGSTYDGGAGAGGLAFNVGTAATPDAPIVQTATSTYSNLVWLTWLPTQITGPTYSVFRNGTQIASGIAYETLSYTDTEAPIGIWVLYTVKASNSVGTSAASNAVSGLRVLLLDSIAEPDEVLTTATTLNADKNGYTAGTATGGSSDTYPDHAFVHSDAGTYGPTGTEYTPSLSAVENWVLKTDVVDAAHVELDVPRWTGATGEDVGTLVVTSGGSSALTEQDVGQLRYRLGLDGTATAPTTATSNLAIGAADRNAIADAVLSRPVANVEATADVGSLCYVVLAMANASMTTHPGRLTIFRTDGTEFAQRSITSQFGANPITGVTPWTDSTT